MNKERNKRKNDRWKDEEITLLEKRIALYVEENEKNQKSIDDLNKWIKELKDI